MYIHVATTTESLLANIETVPDVRKVCSHMILLHSCNVPAVNKPTQSLPHIRELPNNDTCSVSSIVIDHKGLLSNSHKPRPVYTTNSDSNLLKLILKNIPSLCQPKKKLAQLISPIPDPNL